MDKKSLIVVALCFVLYFGWQTAVEHYWPSSPARGSAAGTGTVTSATPSAVKPSETKAAPLSPSAPVAAPVRPAPKAPEKIVTLENKLLRAELTSYGGGIRDVLLKNWKVSVKNPGPVTLNRFASGNTRPIFSLTGGTTKDAAGVVSTQPWRGADSRAIYTLTESGPDRVVFTSEAMDGLRIVKEFALSGEYGLVCKLRLENTGTRPLETPAFGVEIGTAGQLDAQDDPTFVKADYWDGGPLSLTGRANAVYTAASSLTGSTPEFSAGEFSGMYTTAGLWEALKADGLSVPDAKTDEDRIKWFNDLLKGDSPEFLPGEFSGAYTTAGLLKAFQADGIRLAAAKTDNDRIQLLNNLLSGSRLYQTFKEIPRFMAIHLTDEAGDLAVRESSLNDSQRARLNRLILEAVYPNECPKKPKGDVLEKFKVVPRFKELALTDEAENLLAREPSLNENERLRLNRLILEAAYPGKCPRKATKDLLATGGVHWAAVKDRYFALVLTPKEPARGFHAQEVDLPRSLTPTSSTPPAGARAWLLMDGVKLDARASATREFQLYAGPKEYKRLTALGDKQEEVMEFGKFGRIAEALLWSLISIYKIIPSYGVAIIVITLIIKLLFWPIQAMSTRSMKKMQELQPLVNKLKEKYPDDPEKQNQEMMKLWREHKVNPVGGCLPLLAQIPVLYAFYSMLQVVIELRGAKFLWIQDLSRPDTIFSLAGIPVNPLPLAMVATQFWQQKLTPSTSADPNQQKMMMLMPLMFVFMFYNVSSGLVLYWTVQNLLSILQQWMALRDKNKTGAATAPVKR
jgi:YidC/Oxa1 family membrane protein insertase